MVTTECEEGIPGSAIGASVDNLFEYIGKIHGADRTDDFVGGKKIS